MTINTKQVYLYSLSTEDFLTESEFELKKQYNTIKFYEDNCNKLNYKLNNTETEEDYKKAQDKINELTNDYNKFLKLYINEDKEVKELDGKEIKKVLKVIDNKFYEQINSCVKVRELNKKRLKDEKKIAQFQSILTRALNLQADETTTDFMIVEIYYRQIMKQLLEKGFNFNNQHYIFAFAGAGQIRTKKLVFANEKKYKAIQGKLFAGLTDEMINSHESKYVDDNGKEETVHGMILGKLNAYKALSASSTETWKGFNIDKCIVVPDFEYEIMNVKQEYINKEYKIIPRTASMINPVTDGAGVMLPKVSNKNTQFRSAWFKGLLTPFDFLKFAEVNDIKNTTVKDVWGKEWDLKKDGIEIIFTESQFKMRKYYSSWESYKKAFKENDCEFALLNEESLNDNYFEDKRLSYQMIQTLYNLSDDELKEIAKPTVEYIKTGTESTENMLEFIGVTKSNQHKREIQEALLVDNTLIYDPYVKQMVKNKKSSMIKDARAGGLMIPGTKRMYILPDVISFGQYLFGLEITGGLESNEVSCSLFEDKQKLDMMRSPHLHIEHIIVNNILDKEFEINKGHKLSIKDWYITKGIYTSIKSTASFELAFDVDGDEATVVSNQTFVDVAERHMKENNVLPLAYEMKKGKPVEITPKNMFDSLIASFGVNIGDTSNMITKIFAKGKDNITKEDIDIVKLLKFYNNMQIDFAKTLWIAEQSNELKTKFNKLKSGKLPSFMIQAKNKKKRQVLERGNSTVDRLFDLIKVPNIKFGKGEFDYTRLMKNKNIEINKTITDKYDELMAIKSYELKKQIEKQDDEKLQVAIIKYLRNELLNSDDNLGVDEVVDVLVKYLYESGTEHKQVFWDCFGKEMLFNLKRSLGLLHKCECCEEFEKKSNRQTKCPSCADKAKKEGAKLRKRNQRNKQAS